MSQIIIHNSRHLRERQTFLLRHIISKLLSQLSFVLVWIEFAVIEMNGPVHQAMKPHNRATWKCSGELIVSQKRKMWMNTYI